MGRCHSIKLIVVVLLLLAVVGGGVDNWPEIIFKSAETITNFFFLSQKKKM